MVLKNCGQMPRSNIYTTMLNKNVTSKIADILLKAVKKYFLQNLPGEEYSGDLCFMEESLQIPRDKNHGDLATNLAMRLAKTAKNSPQAIAESLSNIIRDELKVSKGFHTKILVSVMGGFINFTLPCEYFMDLLMQIKKEDADFGKSTRGNGEHVNLEFVSANPTGPLTIAHGRQAAIGDALSRILRFDGYEVTNEYYLNDYGRQINLLGTSVKIRYFELFDRNIPMPEDAYVGGYIKDISSKIKEEKGDTLLAESEENDTFFREYAVKYIMGLIHKDLSDFGVKFDIWTPQSRIEKGGEVEESLELLKKEGYIYKDEGAVWFSSTKLGDDKDRVVIKSDGSFTYLAPDIAYHFDKYRRNYTKLIDLLGPDHHGYIKRMKAAVEALGHDSKSLDILIVQLVTLMRGGEAVSMSTRKGEFISLRELIDELGKDVTRFYFLSRKLDSHLDFDIEVAKKESQDNPVFYIQYAHARICSIKKYSNKNRILLWFKKTDLSLLSKEQEKQLMKKLNEFPAAVKASAEALEPNRLVAYLNELARCFHSFYTECRVVSDDMSLSKTRLFLVECTRIVLANGLRLLNITLPEKM